MFGENRCFQQQTFDNVAGGYFRQRVAAVGVVSLTRPAGGHHGKISEVEEGEGQGQERSEGCGRENQEKGRREGCREEGRGARQAEETGEGRRQEERRTQARGQEHDHRPACH